jgi:hypothetical protein
VARNGAEASDLIRVAHRDHDSLLQRSRRFDDKFDGRHALLLLPAAQVCPLSVAPDSQLGGKRPSGLRISFVTGKPRSPGKEAAQALSFAAFDGAEVSVEFFANGGVTSPPSEVMRRFSGDVEFEGTFQGFWPNGLSGRPPQIKMSTGMHIYPDAKAVEQWRALPIGTKVRFKATIEGIGKYKFANVEVVQVSLKGAVPLVH